CGGSKWKLVKGQLILAKGELRDTLYRATLRKNKADFCATLQKSEAGLWHRRLGHLSRRGVDILKNKGLIKFKGNEGQHVCENCMFGKQHKVSFET
ncbi:hypothetical protein M569_10508, partial [Genlisea aurea]